MANELKALVAASSTGNFVLVVNPSNNAQAWDTDADAWATYNRTDSDQQIALGSPIAAGAGDEWQFANLPTGLDTDSVYEYHVFDSDDELLGPMVYQPALSLQEGIATESEPGAIEGAIGAVGTAAAYAKDDAKGPREWTWPKDVSNPHSTRIITEKAAFGGTLKFDLTNRLNAGAGVHTITSVTCSPSSGITIVGPNDAANPVKTSDNQGVLFDPSGFVAGTTYTFTCTVATTDHDDALVSTGTFKAT